MCILVPRAGRSLVNFIGVLRHVDYFVRRVGDGDKVIDAVIIPASTGVCCWLTVKKLAEHGVCSTKSLTMTCNAVRYRHSGWRKSSCRSCAS